LVGKIVDHCIRGGHFLRNAPIVLSPRAVVLEDERAAAIQKFREREEITIDAIELAEV
jgi:hypothetical protein